MKNLIIIGARGYGREVFSIAQNSIGYNTEFTIKGFLDSDDKALGSLENYPAIISSVEEYVLQEDDVFVCALGSVKWKKYYVDIIKKKDGQFVNLIHKTNILNNNVKFGVGNVIGEHCVLSNDIEIGNHVTIHCFSVFGHDVKIGNYCHIGAYCFFGGFAVVKDNVTLYVRATVLDRITVNAGSTVGASSLVIKNVKENVTVFGTPAKILEI